MAENKEPLVDTETSVKQYIDFDEVGLLLELGLYKKIEIDPVIKDDLLAFLSMDTMIHQFNEPTIFDCFCPQCKKESTFVDLYRTLKRTSINMDVTLDMSRQRYVYPPANPNLSERVYIKEYVCTRNNKHIHSFYFLFDGTHLTKVGQTLSLTQSFAAETKKYRKHFPDIQNELFSSMKLFSEGFGVAAILYLRRIFEKLINNASSEHCMNHPQDAELLRDARMVERITILKDRLPNFLVQNKSMYAILSTAVHELEEDLCLGAYPFIKDSILMILDQETERISLQKKEQTLAKDLQSFQSLLGRRKTQ